MTFLIIISLSIIAFACAYIDVAFGMGYGTLMSPVLLIFGYAVSVIIPVLLLSQMCCGLSACIFHQRFKNADFKSKNQTDTKKALIFTAFGGIAMTFAVVLVISIPNIYLMIYTGVMIAVVGLILLLKKGFNVSEKKMLMIGGLGAFNKALSGGGFGPLITSGQIMSGSEAKNAVAITSFSETILSAFGFIIFVLFAGGIDLFLSIVIIISGIMASPLGAFHAKKFKAKKGKAIIGSATLILGILTLLKCFF